MFRSKTDSTAIVASNRMSELAIYDPFVQQLLRDSLPSFDPTMFAVLQYDLVDRRVDPDADPLLASSRKALISVTEVQIQKLWSKFYVALSPEGPMSLEIVDSWLSSYFFPSFFELLGYVQRLDAPIFKSN